MMAELATYGCRVCTEEYLQKFPLARSGWPLYKQSELMTCRCCHFWLCKKHYGGHRH